MVDIAGIGSTLFRERMIESPPVNKTCLAAALLCAGSAIAHQGVTNATVMERMMGMSALETAMKPLAAMANGKQGFDAGLAASSRSALVEHARAIPALFADEATDPKSEALPGIWSDPTGFANAAAEVLDASEALDVSTLQNLRTGLARVGAGCANCHYDYRK